MTKVGEGGEGEGSRSPDERRLENEKKDKKFLRPLVNRVPGNQYAQRRQKRSQHHQPQRNAVNPHVIVNVRRCDPLEIDLVLEISVRSLEMDRQMKRHSKRQ